MPEEFNEGIQEVITYSNQYGKCTIGTVEECSHIDSMINNLIRPLLKAAGFADATITDALGEY